MSRITGKLSTEQVNQEGSLLTGRIIVKNEVIYLTEGIPETSKTVKFNTAQLIAGGSWEHMSSLKMAIAVMTDDSNGQFIEMIDKPGEDKYPNGPVVSPLTHPRSSRVSYNNGGESLIIDNVKQIRIMLYWDYDENGYVPYVGTIEPNKVVVIGTLSYDIIEDTPVE